MATPMPEIPAAHPAEALPDVLPADPFPLFLSWFDEAMHRKLQPNPNAMTLATVDARGEISARIVLCKEVEPATGSLVFHTNYNSRKGRALGENPKAAVVFHWDHLERQVRLEGSITKVSPEESDAYFKTRPWERRVGAWASQQSQPLKSRDDLLIAVGQEMMRFGLSPLDPPKPDASPEIPRPPHWGGYRLTARSVELWMGIQGRLHDRAVWTREVPSGAWASTRLQP
jgi:pyridoxamine 5'-phosphate oxidase